MFIIEIKNKYIYTIYRNRRPVGSYTTKKQAKLKLIEFYQDFTLLNQKQNLFRITPIFLQGKESLVVYYERRRTLQNNTGEEWKDNFSIKRELNI